MAKERGMSHSWEDFPKRKDELGFNLCRFCGKALTGRRTSWCSKQCTIEVLLLCDWSFIRNKVKRRDKYRCVLCHRNKHEAGSLEVDHIVELQDGGQTVMENLRTMCLESHKVKTKLMKTARFERRVVLSQKELSTLPCISKKWAGLPVLSI
jgi:5-methylcytosine-specific restriction endonuclease McrA